MDVFFHCVGSYVRRDVRRPLVKVKAGLRRKEARLEALKKASEKTRKTGQPEQAFSDSTYAVR